MQQENMKTLESLEDFRHFSEKELEIRFDQLKKQIVPADKTIREQAEKHWGHVAKPLGSLGVLEEDIVRAAAAQGEEVPDFSKRALLIFCADNGVVEEGVSQTGQEVTAAVVSNMTRGRSCSCLMAEKAETEVFPIDMGIACEVEHRGELHPLTERKIPWNFQFYKSSSDDAPGGVDSHFDGNRCSACAEGAGVPLVCSG